jgi:hypothetical protein
MIKSAVPLLALTLAGLLAVAGCSATVEPGTIAGQESPSGQDPTSDDPNSDEWWSPEPTDSPAPAMPLLELTDLSVNDLAAFGLPAENFATPPPPAPGVPIMFKVVLKASNGPFEHGVAAFGFIGKSDADTDGPGLECLQGTDWQQGEIECWPQGESFWDGRTFIDAQFSDGIYYLVLNVGISDGAETSRQTFRINVLDGTFST